MSAPHYHRNENEPLDSKRFPKLLRPHPRHDPRLLAALYSALCLGDCWPAGQLDEREHPTGPHSRAPRGGIETRGR